MLKMTTMTVADIQLASDGSKVTIEIDDDGLYSVNVFAGVMPGAIMGIGSMGGLETADDAFGVIERGLLSGEFAQLEARN